MATTTKRLAAAERREAILDAAVEEFATHGYEAATTAAIAGRAGISQPYVFRFFPRKKDLYIAVIERATSRILTGWEAAVPEPGESRIEALGRTYVERIPERRKELMLKFGAYGAAHDDEIAAAARLQLARVWRYVVHQAERDGAEDPHFEATRFVGIGFFINAAMAVGLESSLTAEEWIKVCGREGIARIEDRLDDVA